MSEGANPLLEGLRLRRSPDPCVLVIFGATGDLAYKKLFPALYQLSARRVLNGRPIVGVANATRAGDCSGFL